MSPQKRQNLLDRIGLTGSMVCALHCAALPVLLAALPSLGLGLGSEHLEAAFVLFATGLGLYTILWGWRRHRAVRALGLLVPGLGALWFGLLYPPVHHSLLAHALVMTVGGVMVGLAHLINLRLSHRHCRSADCTH